jgi:N-methylhydantoinase A
VRPGPIADGQVVVNREAAEAAVAEQIARPLGIATLEAADGIHRIANAHTLRALRAVSVERGYDPRVFTLVAFGGSGPLHAAALARELGCRRVIIPPSPGLFSAVGLLVSGVERHDVRSCLLIADQGAEDALRAIVEDLRSQMLERFAREGFAPELVSLSWSVDARFRGQAHELRIPLPAAPGEHTAALSGDFSAEHLRLYGHADSATPVELVAVRLVGRTPAPGLELGVGQAVRDSSGERQVYFGQRWGLITTPVVTRTALRQPTNGPLLIDEYDSTTVVPPDAHVWLDDQGQLVMELRDGD